MNRTRAFLDFTTTVMKIENYSAIGSPYYIEDNKYPQFRVYHDLPMTRIQL